MPRDHYQNQDHELDWHEPHPDIHALFAHYNAVYFGGILGATSVQYSSARMTSCAGTCTYQDGGASIIRLSEPLLKFRPSADLKDVLLHEMIHAYCFVRRLKAGPDGHGGPFLAKMHEINASTAPDFHRPPQGYHLNTTHGFVDEVALYQTHHWQCQRCGDLIKRANNRKPQPADCGSGKAAPKPCPKQGCAFCRHLRACGHSPPAEYVKIAEPEGFGKKRGGKRRKGGEAPKFADGNPLPAKRPRGSPRGTPTRSITDFFRRTDPGSPRERERRAAAAEGRLQAQLEAAEAERRAKGKAAAVEPAGREQEGEAEGPGAVPAAGVIVLSSDDESEGGWPQARRGQQWPPGAGGRGPLGGEAGSSRDHAEGGWGGARERGVECPVCMEEFAESQIEGHVLGCLT